MLNALLFIGGGGGGGFFARLTGGGGIVFFGPALPFVSTADQLVDLEGVVLTLDMGLSDLSYSSCLFSKFVET